RYDCGRPVYQRDSRWPQASGAQGQRRRFGNTINRTEQSIKYRGVVDMTFPPIKYVVPGVIVEGLTLFAGKPKIGKSWLVLHAAVGVGRGGFTLGHLKCKEGDVLYCALEDNARRLQSRLTKLLGLPPWDVKRVDFLCEMPRLVAAMNARTLARSSSVIQ